MKKLLAGILFAISAVAQAAPWDLEISQYDQFGAGRIPRLLTLPASSAAGILIYNPSTNLPMLATVDSSMSISSGGVVSVNTSGFATTSQLATKFDIPVGTTAQYLRGDGTLATFPSIPAGQIQADWTQANSGALDFIKNKPTLTSGTVTSITAGTGLSGGTITTSGTISMPNTGTAGTYSGVTTDAQGRVSAGTSRSFNYTTRALNTCFQVSATRDALATYSVDIATVSTLLNGQVGTIYLRIYTNSGCTTGTQEITRFVNGNTQSLGLTVTMNQNVTGTLTGVIPAGSYVQLVTENTTGTPSFTARPGQEVLL